MADLEEKVQGLINENERLSSLLEEKVEEIEIVNSRQKNTMSHI